MTPSLETLQSSRFERDHHAAGFGNESLPVDHAFFEQSPAQPLVMRVVHESYADAEASANDAQDLAMRIRLLIAREGSASALARRCGRIVRLKDGRIVADERV